MALTIDESFLPATLTAPPMTDAGFAHFCNEHPDLFFEMNADGEIIVMAPTYFLSGVRNSRISRQLDAWAEQDARGEATDSSTGFVLPNGARRSADASWTRAEKFDHLSEDELDELWHLCPDFVIELRLKSDRKGVLRKKMQEWIDNGVQLGWLLDPKTKTVEIYRPNREPEILTGLKSITGESPVNGFVLDLTKVWKPLSKK